MILSQLAGVLLVNGAYIHFEHPKHDLEDQNTMDLFVAWWENQGVR